MELNEIMKLQMIFGTSWIELSKREIERKTRIKAEQNSVTKNPNKTDEDYKAQLAICQRLSEALNPDNWEKLGANEISVRIREFQSSEV